jgi:hypothetical protein
MGGAVFFCVFIHPSTSCLHVCDEVNTRALTPRKHAYSCQCFYFLVSLGGHIVHMYRRIHLQSVRTQTPKPKLTWQRRLYGVFPEDEDVLTGRHVLADLAAEFHLFAANFDGSIHYCKCQGYELVF